MITEHAASARAPQTSIPLQLSIGDIEDGDIGVAPPTIVEADDDRVVDLGTFEGNATVHVDAWPLMAAGQRYWLTAIAGTETYVVADGALVTGPATLDLPLPRAWLEGLADVASFDIELAIAFGGGELATAKRFTSAVYTLRSEGPDTGWSGIEYIYEPLDQYISRSIYVRFNQPYTLRFATLYNLYNAQTVYVSDRGIDGWVHPTLVYTRLILDYPIPRLDFSVANPPNSIEIIAYDSAGGEIVRQPLVQNNTLWAGSSTGIRSLEFMRTISSLTRVGIDNIKVWTGSTWRGLSTPLIEDFAHWPMEEHDRRLDVGNWSIAGDTCSIAVTPYPTDPQRRTLRFSRMQDTSALYNYVVHLTPRGLVTPKNKVSVKIRRERATGDHLASVKTILAYSNTTNAIEDSGPEADALRIVGPIAHPFPSTELEYLATFAGLEQMPLPGEHLAFICIEMQFSPSTGWVPVFIDEIAIE